METKLGDIFAKNKYKAEEHLKEKTWQNILKHDRNIAVRKLWLFSLLGILSLIGLVPMLKMLSTDLAQSGFYEYLSLLFSDGASVLSFWKEFSFSLAESLPLVSIILSFSLVFIFFLSIKYIARQIIRSRVVLSY